MKRCLIANLLFALLLAGSCVEAAENYDAQWIWAKTPVSATPQTVWFRTEVRSTQPSTGIVRILCDDKFVLWVNGQRIGEGGGDKVFRFNLNDPGYWFRIVGDP